MPYEIIDLDPLDLWLRRIKSKNKFGLIDQEDHIVLDPIYDNIEKMYKTRSLFVCRMEDLYCFLNDKGVAICEASYKYIEPARETKQWYLVEVPYNEVFYEMGQGFTFNYINSYGNLLFSEKTFLINASPFKDGKALVLPAPFIELVVINNYGSPIKSHPYEVSKVFMPLVFSETFFNIGSKDEITIYGANGEIVVELGDDVTFSYHKSGFFSRIFMRIVLWFTSLFLSIGSNRFEHKSYSNFIKNIINDGPFGLHPNLPPKKN